MMASLLGCVDYFVLYFEPAIMCRAIITPAGPFALGDGESGQVRKEAATAILLKCRSQARPKIPKWAVDQVHRLFLFERSKSIWMAQSQWKIQHEFTSSGA